MTREQHEAATDYAYAIARQLDEAPSVGAIDWKSLMQKLIQLFITLAPIIIPLITTPPADKPPANDAAPPPTA